jgi:hypothetical protein
MAEGSTRRFSPPHLPQALPAEVYRSLSHEFASTSQPPSVSSNDLPVSNVVYPSWTVLMVSYSLGQVAMAGEARGARRAPRVDLRRLRQRLHDAVDLAHCTQTKLYRYRCYSISLY